MYCDRLLLAALHYNENADREQATNNDGQLQYSIRFPKYKKGSFTVTALKEDPTYGTDSDSMLCVQPMHLPVNDIAVI